MSSASRSQEPRPRQGGLLVERAGAVATIIFNRPAVRNAINSAMWRQLQAALRGLAEDQEVRVVLFRGAGEEAFSAGADITEFDRTRTSREAAYEAFNLIESTLQQIEALPQATIALLKGYAVGAGCELAAACDLRVAALEAKIGIPAAKLGITIGHGHIRRLVRLVGPARAKDLLLTGRLLDGQRAYEVGLADYVAPLAELDGLAEGLARQIADNAPGAMRWAKGAIRRVLDDPALSSVHDDAAESIDYHATEEFAEGVRAFEERREPKF